MTGQPTVVVLGPADHDAILRVLRDDGGYAERVNGRPASDDDAAELLTVRPPQVADEHHHVMGLRIDDDLVGVASVVVGWPEPDVAFLGLLQLRADHQGHGLARYFHGQLRAMFPGRWRISVVDSNAQVIAVWERLVHSPTGRRAEWTSRSGLGHMTIEMEAPRT